jgi:hypothetical protein
MIADLVPGVDWTSMFVWNCFLTRTMRQVLGGDEWVVPVIHGYFEQRRLSGEFVQLKRLSG